MQVRRKHHLTMLKGRFKEVFLCVAGSLMLSTRSPCSPAQSAPALWQKWSGWCHFWMRRVRASGSSPLSSASAVLEAACGMEEASSFKKPGSMTWRTPLWKVTRPSWTLCEREMNLCETLNHWHSHLFWLLFLTRAYHHLHTLLDCLSFSKAKTKS